ncbi:MAG: hypothetical protein JO278_14425 [Dyella sp.]|nr:hypothetical protein [Dyella sp.]
MIRHFATCFTLGVFATAASTIALARDYADERDVPVYVEPAPPVVYGQPPAIVAGPTVIIGWHGDRYWDGHRWWERDEWNRHHPHDQERHHDDHHDAHHDDHHDDHHDNHHD